MVFTCNTGECCFLMQSTFWGCFSVLYSKMNFTHAPQKITKQILISSWPPGSLQQHPIYFIHHKSSTGALMCLYCHREALHWFHPLFLFALPVFKSESAAHKQDDKLGQPAFPFCYIRRLSVCVSPWQPAKLRPAPCQRGGWWSHVVQLTPFDTHIHKDTHTQIEDSREMRW